MRNEREANSQLHRQVKLTEAELDRLNAKYHGPPEEIWDRPETKQPRELWEVIVVLLVIGASILAMSLLIVQVIKLFTGG